MNYQNNKTETSVIQLALKRAGLLEGEIDGIFGSDTRNAVTQRVHDSPCKKGRFALFDCRHAQYKHKKNYACKSDG